MQAKLDLSDLILLLPKDYAVFATLTGVKEEKMTAFISTNEKCLTSIREAFFVDRRSKGVGPTSILLNRTRRQFLGPKGSQISSSA